MKLVNVGDICRFEYGKSLSEKIRRSGDFVVYGSNGPVGNHSESFTSGTTIIIGRKGSIGAIHVSPDSCWPIDTTYFIDSTCTNCDLEWLAFHLRHLRLEELNKASGVPGLNREDAYKRSIWLPETEEAQRQIATRLKTQLAEVETARQAAQKQVQDTVLLRSRLLQQAFDTLCDVPRKVLGEWAKTTSGSTPPRGDKRYWSPAEVPWVKTGEVAFAPITATEEAISRQALAECSLTLLPPQTVLIAMYGQGKTRGQSAVLQVEATTNQACFAILPNDFWDTDFLHHWLMASYEDLRNLSDGRGGNQANLNGALLNALEIPVPAIDEQRRIVTRLKTQLTEADAIHQAATAQLAEIERLPQRLLAQAFAPPTTQGNVT
jgi:type I restriction enzyme S subunit